MKILHLREDMKTALLLHLTCYCTLAVVRFTYKCPITLLNHVAVYHREIEEGNFLLLTVVVLHA